MNQILFLDLDSWPSFFHSMPDFLPQRTFVWAFYSSKMKWILPKHRPVFINCNERKCFNLTQVEGTTPSAVKMKAVVDKMDSTLLNHVLFTVIGKQESFSSLADVMKSSNRVVNVIDPDQESVQQVYINICHVLLDL